MKNDWLPYTLLRAASLLTPVDQRAAWLQEWQSELWYIPRRGAAMFCFGAFRDALWVRRNDTTPARTGSRLESPRSCLAVLAALAAVSLLIALCLLGPLRLRTTLWRLSARDLPVGCIGMLLYTSLLLPITRLVVGQAVIENCPVPWRARLRRGLFLTAKIALVQPIMLCGFFVLILAGPVVPFLSPLAMFAMWSLTIRWLILDQQRRCPVCLHALTKPVRIGTPSQSFLEWYGAELMCSRGHGLLQVPEISASYSGRRKWRRLDASWGGLFARSAGARQG